MRIIINGWFTDQPTTGSGQYLTALLEWLPRLGTEHEFIVVQPMVVQPRTGEAARLTFRVSPSTLHIARFSPDLAKLWFEQVAFPWACRRLRADVAFVPYWAAPLWSPCPVVVTIHDLIPLLLPFYRGGPLQRAYTALVSHTARRAAAVVTDSEASRRDIIAHLRIPPSRVRAIHLAADPRHRPVAEAAELARVRAKYGLPEGPFLFYLGGFDARKNVVRMVEAFARAVGRSSSVIHLVIAGRLPAADTPFAPDPRPVVARLGIADRVRFIGPVDEEDKPALYALAQGTIFVSEYEGFGLPVLEAMMAEAGN
ncbi:MAG: glycosyltransferase family 4 protein [Anaerolineae bacterium]